EKGGECPCAHIEAFLEEFIGCEHAQPVEHGNERNTQYDHGQWQAEVELHKAHARGVSEPRSRKERDGTGLRSHYGKGYMIPGQRFVTQQIPVDIADALAFVHAVGDDKKQGTEKDNPIRRTHPKWLVKK